MRVSDKVRSCLSMYRSSNRRLIIQSISVSTALKSCPSTAFKDRSQRSSTRSTVGSARNPRRSTYWATFSRYSHCICRADSSRPVAKGTCRVPVVSWLISRMARIGFSKDMSRMTIPDSSMRKTRSAAPTLSSEVVSLMLLSPTITCSRR